MGPLKIAWNKLVHSTRARYLGIAMVLVLSLAAGNASNPTSLASTQTQTSATAAPAQILSLVDNYLNCIDKNTNDGLQTCVDLLSTHPGEMRDTITANPGMFLEHWKQYAFGYQLYYCADNTVLEGYIEYSRDNPFKPVSPTPDYLRYTFSNSDGTQRIVQAFNTLAEFNDWRTQNGLTRVANITSDCEFMPRINHTPLIPSA